MEETKNRKKLGTKAIVAIIGGAVALAAIVLICVLRNKEEAYRNIKVSEVIGTVIVSREGMKDLNAYANMNLLSGDAIVTEAGARLALRLDDDKYVILDEQSKLTLHATGTEEDSKTTLNLEYGAVFSDIKNKLSESSGYEVVTPASTMSVRGTKFEVVYREGQVKVLTYEGAVYVAPEGAEEGRMVSAGQRDVVVEASDGTCGFEGETKAITAEDIGVFVRSYLEESGIEYESDDEQDVAVEPTKTPEVEPSIVPTVTATPAPTVTPKPTATPEPEEGEAIVRFCIPNPPKDLLQQNNTYTLTYVDGMLVIGEGENAVSYAADMSPYMSVACDPDMDVSPIIITASEEYLPEALAVCMAEYHSETTINCFGWYDATATMWFDWTKYLKDAVLTDGGLNLPAEATLNCVSSDGGLIQWVMNGTKTNTTSVGHSTLTNLTLSVTK